MVHTRNQKRKLEEILPENLLIEQDYSSNISVSKKKKIKTETEINTGNVKDKSESESSTKEFICEIESSNEINEESEENVYETESEYNSESDIESCKESGKDIESLIKQSILNLVKKYTNPVYKKEKKNLDTYDKFVSHTNSIYEGVFFERSTIEDKKSKLKNLYTEDEIKLINKELDTIKENYRLNAPSIIEILKSNMDIKGKQKMLEKLYHYTNSDILTPEYTNNLNIIQKNTKHYDDPQLELLENEITKKSSTLEFSDDYRERILRSKMSLHNKILAYKRLEVMESFENTDTSEYAKYKTWMDILLSIPFDEPTINNKEIKDIRKILDKRLSFLEKPKDQIINIYTQMIRNPDFTVNAIGLYGPKGVGKSSIIKSISEALDRPYRTISLGGESDSSLLTGHSFTYIGSIPGRIIEILRETKCTNPIILFDELDKVSESHHGKEIIGNLIHLTDSTTNNKYNYDKYFAGLEFDLSKVLFVFTYNDQSKVDSILSDRLFKINIENYSLKEKLEITRLHIIPNILQKYHFQNETIKLSDDTIDYIVEKNTKDQGMRDINRKIETIISRINTLLLTTPEDNIVKLKYKKLYPSFNKNTVLPVTILKEHIDILLSDSFTTDSDNLNDPPFGMYI
jgi:ATP-dependent Lon protease